MVPGLASAFGQMNLDTFTEARYHLANSVDANGNGTAWQKNPQGVVTLSVTYKNGLPDGDFLWPGGGGSDKRGILRLGHLSDCGDLPCRLRR